MAIQIEYNYGGYTLPTAYLKATIGRADTNTTVIVYQVWPTQADRDANRAAVDSGAHVLPTDLNAEVNPIAYAYDLLKTLPAYAAAIDV